MLRAFYINIVNILKSKIKTKTKIDPKLKNSELCLYFNVIGKKL